MQLKSVMNHVFSQIPDVKLQRSKFNRSHGLKTTFSSGYLYPIFVDEALPGDTFNVKMTAFARMATPLKPIMDNLYMDTFFFAVPCRLLWDNWKKFNGEQINPGDSTDFLVPQIEYGQNGHISCREGSLGDYFGLPIKAMPDDGKPMYCSALWHRAYNKIYNEWFRDENLINSLTVPTTDGPDDPALYELQRRGKRFDYFTSALPWPQKGASVVLPLGTEAPVIGIGKIDYDFVGGVQMLRESDGESRQYASSAPIDVDPISSRFYVEQDPNHAGFPYIRADLSTATAATINALRQAMAVQKIYEREARGGSRYIEIIRSFFGVVSPDQRIQRSEYLGGGSSPIVINPVVQNSASVAGNTPQGNLAAVGIGKAFHGFVKSFTEHCVLIGLVNVRADLTYQQGLDRMFSRRTRWDYYWPGLANLGEQTVLNKEIFFSANAPIDDAVFGYQERYAEYRYKPSKITGKFRSDCTGTLDVWHLSQEFGALPTLGKDFIEENPPISRVIATPTEPEFIFDSYFDMTCVRPMPVYSIPGGLDRF